MHNKTRQKDNRESINLMLQIKNDQACEMLRSSQSRNGVLTMARRGENIYKRKDGRWEGRYIKGRKTGGKIYYGYIYGYKYSEVKNKLIFIKYEKQATGKKDIMAYDGYFSDWIHYWLDNFVHPRVKNSTYASYKNKVTVHILPKLGNIKLQELKKSDFEELLIEMRVQLKASSIKAIFSVIINCLNKALVMNLILENPCVGLEFPKIEKKTVQALSAQDQMKLVKEVETEQKFFSIILALQTGLRIGEICGLKWEDIDFENNILYVNRTIQRIQNGKEGEHKTKIIEITPKSSNSQRRIPISEGLRKSLIDIKKTSKSEYIVSNKNKPLEPRTIAYRFQIIRKKIGLESFSFHSLRHSFATRCLEAGGNIAAISSLLGHSSTKMTLDCYTNSFFSEERHLIDKIDIFSS